MSRKNYPEWGLFGAVTEKPVSLPGDQEQRRQNKNNDTGESRMSRKGTFDVGYTKDTIINNISGETIFRVKPEPGDTPEDLAKADTWASREAAKIRLKSQAGGRYRLSGNRDAMSAVIELARSEAVDFEDLHSVWAALVAIAERHDRPAPLLGMTEDGFAVRYRDGDGKSKLFTQAMLKGRLERREKARKST